jgi:hypothetical protein
MPRFLVERRLREVTARLKALRDELAVTDEQGGQFTDEAEDSRLRALVSETPLADHDFRESQRHADAWARRRAEILASIQRLEARQDELLDRLTGS